MNVHVSGETQNKVIALAKEVAKEGVAGYHFDGNSLKPLPAVTIRDTIIAKIADPKKLL